MDTWVACAATVGLSLATALALSCTMSEANPPPPSSPPPMPSKLRRRYPNACRTYHLEGPMQILLDAIGAGHAKQCHAVLMGIDDYFERVARPHVCSFALNAANLKVVRMLEDLCLSVNQALVDPHRLREWHRSQSESVPRILAAMDDALQSVILCRASR